MLRRAAGRTDQITSKLQNRSILLILNDRRAAYSHAVSLCQGVVPVRKSTNLGRGNYSCTEKSHIEISNATAKAPLFTSWSKINPRISMLDNRQVLGLRRRSARSDVKQGGFKLYNDGTLGIIKVNLSHLSTTVFQSCKFLKFTTTEVNECTIIAWSSQTSA